MTNVEEAMVMAVLIEAGKMCEVRSNDLANDIKGIKEGVKFCVINASDDPGNARYVENKIEYARGLGVDAILFDPDEYYMTEDIIEEIESLKRRGIPVIFQMPAYPHLDAERILSHITPEIDADGFTREWLGEVALGNDTKVAPATPKGVMQLLEHFHVSIEGKNALVIGRSNHVGKPMGTMLTNRGATVTIAHSKTENLQELIRQADIVISCVGKTNLISPKDVKEGAVLIGVGFTYVDGKQILDFDTDDMVNNSKASLVTNRVRCTGKATVHALIDNVVQLYKMRHK